MKVDYIENGDCLSLLRKLPDKCIDLIITSPPYNLEKIHHTGSNRFYGYASYCDELPEDEYQENQINVLNECYRVLKDDGSLFYNHKNRIRNGIQITPYEWLLKCNFVIKQELVWKNGSQNFDKIRFYPMTERIYWLAKSPTVQMFNSIGHHDVFDSSEWKPQGTKEKFKRAFPIKMVTDIISCFPEAKVVLDPYSGSGTTAIGCIKMNVHYIGFEIDKSTYELSLKRIEEENSQFSLFRANVWEGGD
mgnify:CR=1 FL=1